MTTSYFLSRATVVPTFGGGMARWREKLFAQMHRNATAASDFLQPAGQPGRRARHEGADLNDRAVVHLPGAVAGERHGGADGGHRSLGATAALTLGAIGVVYGDIGTSPLYALKQVFANGHVPLDAAQHLRRPLARVLDADGGRLDQVRRPDPARRQQRRGRPDRDARARLAGGARSAAAAPAAALRRHLRHRDLLRRRRHHAGDLGARRGRGPAGRGAGAAHLDRADHAGRADRAVHVPAPRHRARRQAVRPGDGGLVRRSWPRSASRTSATTRRS